VWGAQVISKRGRTVEFGSVSYNQSLAAAASARWGFKGSHPGNLGPVTCT
jgi:hypothetical protein